jgi:bifunctional UDP-N-acetylglucosamine pyrophosphorylase/glucosamine-1-phosphate N-acetyltransferase/UDP-N-acetylglucosamine pyrophosphorylase
MSANSSVAVVLAAGKGTRMKSDLPKVLFPVFDRPMIEYVLDALEKAGVQRVIVVIGYRAQLVREALADRTNLTFVEQTEQLGTGHAVMVCRSELQSHDGPVLIVTGDAPLTRPTSVVQLLEEFQQGRPACILGTLHKDDPHGLGRIVRDERGEFVAIVEEKDATDEQRRGTEVNMSTYVFDCGELLHALDHIDNDNRQAEYYVTDCPGVLRKEGKDVRALAVLEPCEALSVNTVEQLRLVEAELRKMGYSCAK